MIDSRGQKQTLLINDLLRTSACPFYVTERTGIYDILQEQSQPNTKVNDRRLQKSMIAAQSPRGSLANF